MLTKDLYVLDYEKNKNLKTIGFFGGKNSTNYGPEILSNFYPAKFTVKIKERSFTFTCSEQFFMWYKAILFKDMKVAKEILDTGYNPNKYKSLGRKVANYDDFTWNKSRTYAMKFAVKEKFKQNQRLLKYLLATGDAYLIECNPRDNIWAAGVPLNSNYSNPHTWNGENLLGWVIMEVRDELFEDSRVIKNRNGDKIEMLGALIDESGSIVNSGEYRILNNHKNNNGSFPWEVLNLSNYNLKKVDQIKVITYLIDRTFSAKNLYINLKENNHESVRSELTEILNTINKSGEDLLCENYFSLVQMTM